MAHTKRSIVTVVSVIYLVALIVVACYAHYCIQRLSLPIPAILSGLAIVLPALHGVCLERLTRLTHSGLPLTLASRARRSSTTSYSSTRGSRRRRHTNATTLTLLGLTIFTTVLATMAGTHLAPAGALACGLDEKWKQLYRDHQEPEIRRIQDMFNCCGLHSVYDMAWPFAKHDGGRTVRSTCSRTYQRENACFGAWRQEEQIVAGLIVIICGGVVETQMIIVYIPARRPSWMSRVSEVTKPNNHANGNGDARRAIEYHDAENGSAGYTDTPVVRVEDADADAEDEPGDSPRSRQGSVQRAIEARLGIDGEHDEHHTLVASSQTSNDQNEWARS